MKTKFRFVGGRELERALAEFTKTTAKNTARKALRTAAEPILSLYRSLTTVASGGLVRREVMGTRLTRRQAGMNRRLGKSEVEIHIGTADPAGGQEEYGNARQRAKPSLRPAWEQEGGEHAIERIRAALAIEIERTAARIAKRTRKR